MTGLRQFKKELDAYPEFQAEYFRNGFDGCLTVSADADSIRPVRRLLDFGAVYAAFGIHPHVVPLPFLSNNVLCLCKRCTPLTLAARKPHSFCATGQHVHG